MPPQTPTPTPPPAAPQTPTTGSMPNPASQTPQPSVMAAEPASGGGGGKGKLIIAIITVIILVLLIAGGTYYYLNMQNANMAASPAPAADTQALDALKAEVQSVPEEGVAGEFVEVDQDLQGL